MISLKKDWLYYIYKWCSWQFHPEIDWEDYKPRTTTNLCNLFNNIFWGILATLWDVVIWISLFYLLFIAPGMAAGATAYLYVYGIPLAITAASALCAYSIMKAIKYNESRTEEYTITKLTRAAYTGWKERFCPIIKFGEDK